MTIENTNTADAGATTGVGDASVAEIAVTGNDVAAASTPEDNIEKHINIALEAQDGKAQTGNDATEAGQPAGTAAEGDKSAKVGAGTSTSDGTNTNSQQQQGTQEQGTALAGKDLVLKGQGPGGTDLVLKAGVERRLYEQGRLAFDQLRVTQESSQRMHTELQNARKELETTQSAVKAAQGLEPKDLAIAVTLFRDLKTDPAGAIRKLLAEAQGLGLTVEGASGTVTPEGIEAMVQRAVASLTTQQGPSEAEITTNAVNEANQFFGRHPDAKLHEAHIAALLHDNPGADLQTVYFGLREQFIRNGFDWNQPLEAQLQERAATGTQQQQPAPANATNGNSVAMPNGRPNPAGGGAQSSDQPVVMHESTSMDDIIKKAMRDNGMNIQ